MKYILPKKDAGRTDIELVIPAEMGEFTVTEIGNNAFINQQRLARVVIPDGVTSIGVKAFSGCDGIVSIKIPDSLRSIGNKAFSNCKSLEKIKLPGTLQEIGDNPFALCDSLSEIVFTSEPERFEIRDGILIEKTRYRVGLSDDLTAEVDLFHGTYEGRIYVEVEFRSEEEANAFCPPVWFGMEVTGLKGYSNAALSEGRS